MRELGRPKAPRLHSSLVGGLIGALLAGSLALAGCGDDDDDASGTTTTLPLVGATTTTTLPASTPVDPNATTTTTALATGAPGTYTVVSGDSLGAIADRFGVPLADLATANGFDPNSEDNMRTLQVGQVLTIPGAGATTTVAPVDPNATTTVAPADPNATTTAPA